MDITITQTLLNYRDFVSPGTIFVETGSAAGDGIQRALDAGFQEIHSIEAAESWYQLCCERFEAYANVTLHHGRSTDVLGKSTFIDPVDRYVFFLDAHPSGPLSAGHDDVMEKGSESEFSQDKIIKAELRIILAKYPNSVIMIDDQAGVDDYSMGYMSIIQNANPEYQFEFYDENLSGGLLYKNKILVATTRRLA